MRPNTRLRPALCAALALCAAGLGLSSPASAAPAKPAPAPSERLVDALRHDLGLTESQARDRLRQEAAAGRLAPEAERAAGAAFGGSWFDPGSGKLVVGLTRGGPAAAVAGTGADTVTVPHTLAELDRAKTRLDTRAQERPVPPEVHGWRVDPRAGAVVVTVEKGAEEQPGVAAFLRAAERSGPVTVERTGQAAPEPFAAGVVGGDPYYINGNTRCSIGFVVHGGFVTAGHCGTAGSPVTGWDGSAMGSFRGSSFPGNDYAFVGIGNGWWTVPVVLGWGTVSDVLVRGSQEAPVGASICRSGSTTHWHCGTVQGKNETVNYSQGAVHGMTKTSVCAEPGDSGGSFVSGDQAQGVTSGGTGNCSSGGQTWYQPVNEILSVYGLTLVTA